MNKNTVATDGPARITTGVLNVYAGPILKNRIGRIGQAERRSRSEVATMLLLATLNLPGGFTPAELERVKSIK